eukprot:RCo017762
MSGWLRRVPALLCRGSRSAMTLSARAAVSWSPPVLSPSADNSGLQRCPLPPACLHPSDSVCRAPVAPGSQMCPHHTCPRCRQDKSSRESMCGRCSDRARAAHAMPRPCAHGNGQQCMGQAVSGSTLCSAHRCSVAGCGREKSSGQPLCTEHAAMASPQPGTAA